MTDRTDQDGLALAGLWANVHLLRVMINRGLVSPNEVDTIFQGMLDGLELSQSRLAADIEASLAEVFAEMRGWARESWIGPEDPERLGG